MKSERVHPSTGHIRKVIPLKLFLDTVSSPPADGTTRVVWMSSWRMKMRVNDVRLSASVKFPSQDWLNAFLGFVKPGLN